MSEGATYVYVVTSGDYSDFHIEAVFDSEQVAREFCSKPRVFEDWNLNTRHVEVWALNDSMPKAGVLKGVAVPIVYGSLGSFRKVGDEEAEDIVTARCRLAPEIHRWSGTPEVWAYGDTHEQAFKIACDWWAQQKAQQAEGLPSALDTVAV